MTSLVSKKPSSSRCWYFAATEYHLGTLKAKLAKYRSQLLEPSGKKGEKGEGFDVLKSGDARVSTLKSIYYVFRTFVDSYEPCFSHLRWP